MFRGLLIAMLILTGCTSKTTTPTRIVKMPDLPPAYNRIVQNDCEWRKADLSVFNQKNQRVLFRYEYCARQRLNGFEYRDTKLGGKIVPLKEKGIQPSKIHALGIWKLGPSTKDEFLKSYLMQNNSKQSCELLEVTPNIYRVIDSSYKNLPGFDVIENEPPNELLARLNMYDKIHKKRFLYATRCGNLSQKMLAFVDGIVFSIASSKVNYYIDYTSVTYENRG